jgi:HEAT repeat protein
MAACWGAVFTVNPIDAAAQKEAMECQWEPASGEAVITASPGKKLTIEAPEASKGFSKYRCLRWKGPKGEKAIHFRAYKEESGPGFEAFVAEGKEGLTPVWSGLTGLTGEFGERKGYFLDYEPLTKSGKNPYPILYLLDERVKICGFGLAPLDVKMYDPGLMTFREIVFDRLRRWKRGEKSGWGGVSQLKAGGLKKGGAISGKYASLVEGEKGGSLANFLVFEASSSALGLKGKAQIGVPAFSLNDGILDRGWIEGSGGSGEGEFVTARIISSNVPIIALELSLAAGESAKQAKKYNGLKKLTVTTDSSLFEVTVPSDPRKSLDKMLVVEFPKPVTTSCLSIIVDEVWPGASSSGNHTFIGEISPKTGIETGPEFAKLANALHKKGSYVTLNQILTSFSGQAVSVVVDAWDVFDDDMRRYIIDHTEKNLLEGDAGLALAGKQLTWVLENENYNIVTNLVRSFSAAPHLMLQWFEEPPEPAMKEMATMVLHVAGYEEAAKQLIDYYLSKEPPEAFVLDESPLLQLIRMGFEKPLVDRAGIEALSSTNPGQLNQLPPAGHDWCGLVDSLLTNQGQGAAGAYEVEKLISLLYALQKAGEKECSAMLAGKVWALADTFTERYYLLDLYRKLVLSEKCPSCAEQLEAGGMIAGALEQKETQLKVMALEAVGLHGMAPAAIVSSLKVLLDDPSPLVREKAVEALGNMTPRDEKADNKILSMATKDFWPNVRRAAVTAAIGMANVPEEAALEMLADPSADVRKNAVRLVVARGMATQAVGKALIGCASGKTMRWDVKEEAALAFGKLCITGFEKKLEHIVKEGLYPDSSEGEIYASAAALTSLGMLGWKDGFETLQLAAMPVIRTEIRLSAVDALGSIGGEESRQFLKALLGDKDKSVRLAAQAALKKIKLQTKPKCAKIK